MGVRWSGSIGRDLAKAVFAEWFGTDSATTDVLLVLFGANGAPMPWRDIAVAVSSHRVLSLNALQVRVCDLRKAMEVEAVDTVRGEGYALTEVGLAECRLALDQMGEALKSAATQVAA